MTELIDIYDANLDPQGTMDRVQAHMDGRWHRTFHCWIVSTDSRSRRGRLLFQGRSATAKNFPGLLDVSAAGHLMAGESVMDGLREVREELGITIDPEEATFLGERVEVADQANGQRNREYQSVFMATSALELDEYSPDPVEVTALYWLDIEAGLHLFGGDRDVVQLQGFTFENSLAAWEPTHREVSRSDFLPRIQRYYLTTLIMADRLLNGEKYLAIS